MSRKNGRWGEYRYVVYVNGSVFMSYGMKDDAMHTAIMYKKLHNLSNVYIECINPVLNKFRRIQVALA